MEILIISPEFVTKTNWGGVATFNERLTQLLISLGHKVTVCTLDAQSEVQNKPVGYEVLLVSFDQNIPILSRLLTTSFGQIFRRACQKFFPTLYFICRWNVYATIYYLHHQKEFSKFELVHTVNQYLPSLLLSLFWRKKTIMHIQGLHKKLAGWDQPLSLDDRITSMMESIYMYFFADLLVPCSDHVQRELGVFVGSKNNVLIHNFVDSKSIISKLSRTISVHSILFLGRLEYRKGPDILLKSFVKLRQDYPKMQLIFVGDDQTVWWKNSGKSFKFFFQDFIQKYGIENAVRFIPKITHRTELIHFLENFNGIVVVPSRYEPFGFTVAEAMAAGNIVIASNKGGISEIVSHQKSGFLVSPTVSAITTTLVEIQKMKKSQLNQIRKTALQEIRQKFSNLTVVESYKNIIHSIMK